MNESQLEQIVTAWGMDILRFCRITTGSREEDDELYQDTMLTLLEKQEQLDPAQNIKSYAISVALKLWSNRRGKWLRRLRLVPQDSLEALAETGTLSGTEAGASPEEFLLRRAQIAAVRRCLLRHDRFHCQLHRCRRPARHSVHAAPVHGHLCHRHADCCGCALRSDRHHRQAQEHRLIPLPHTSS